MVCPTPGMRIRSGGRGRGLARGRGMGPMSGKPDPDAVMYQYRKGEYLRGLGQNPQEKVAKGVNVLKWVGIVTGAVLAVGGLYLWSKS